MRSRARHTTITAIIALASAGALGLAPASAKPARTVVIVGHIMDSTCLAKGEKPAADHAECARRCIQGGAPIAIVEDRTKQVFIALAPEGVALKDKLLPYVGRRCKLTGEVVKRGGSQFLIVTDVTPEHEHDSKEGGVVAMAGDLHLEVLALKSGEVRVFLSDAFRKPVPLTGRQGRVDVGGTADAAPKSAPLAPDATGKFLVAKLDRFTDPQPEVTIRMPVPKDPNYYITFMLEPRDEAGATPDAPAPASPTPKGSPSPPEVVITVQGGYEPREVVLKKGVTTRLRFVRKESGHCASEVLIPALGVKKALAPLAETVVEVTPKQAGEFEMTCGMKMMRARVIVKE